MTEVSTLDVTEKWIPRTREVLQGSIIYDYYRLYELSLLWWDEVKNNNGEPYTNILMTPEQATAVQYLTCESRLNRPTFHGAIIDVK